MYVLVVRPPRSRVEVKFPSGGSGPVPRVQHARTHLGDTRAVHSSVEPRVVSDAVAMSALLCASSLAARTAHHAGRGSSRDALPPRAPNAPRVPRSVFAPRAAASSGDGDADAPYVPGGPIQNACIVITGRGSEPRAVQSIETPRHSQLPLRGSNAARANPRFWNFGYRCG